jgi:transposase
MQKAEITDTHGETIERLKKAKTKHQNIPKAQTKITVIMMCMDGHGVLEISRTLKMSNTTVGSYIKRFNSGGLAELLDYVRASGAPCKLSDAERQFCYEVFQQTPKEAGFGVSANWTSPMMQEFIEKEFGKKLTPTGIQKMLHRMGFSFTRPTYTLARADKKNHGV